MTSILSRPRNVVYELQTPDAAPIRLAVPEGLVGRWDRLGIARLVMHLMSNAWKNGRMGGGSAFHAAPRGRPSSSAGEADATR